ncbi:MAG: hypothetical protein WC980_10410 [Candidatus Brocadiia bacterium]
MRRFSAKCIIIIGLLAVAAIIGADDESAKVYLKKSRELAQKKDYAGALTNLRKAIDESTEMPDAYFERGLLFYDVKELGEAAKDFNKAADLLRSKTELTAPQKEMQRKINICLQECNKIATEFSDINKKYISRFVSLAEKYQDSGDEYLVSMLTWLSTKVPGDREVKDKLGKIKDIILTQTKSCMLPLFNGSDLNGWEIPPPYWSVKEGEIVGDVMRGSCPFKSGVILSDNYMLSVNCSIKEAEAMNAAGLAIASREDGLYFFGIYEKSIYLIRFSAIMQGGQKSMSGKCLAKRALPESLDYNGWAEITAKVKNNEFIGYLNNEVQFNIKVPEEKAGFKGAPGLFIQNCKAHFKEVLHLSE